MLKDIFSGRLSGLYWETRRLTGFKQTHTNPSFACVASVSVQFRSKERGMSVKHCAKSGVSKRAGRGWGRKEGNTCRQTLGF